MRSFGVKFRSLRQSRPEKGESLEKNYNYSQLPNIFVLLSFFDELSHHFRVQIFYSYNRKNMIDQFFGPWCIYDLKIGNLSQNFKNHSQLPIFYFITLFISFYIIWGYIKFILVADHKLYRNMSDLVESIALSRGIPCKIVKIAHIFTIVFLTYCCL